MTPDDRNWRPSAAEREAILAGVVRADRSDEDSVNGTRCTYEPYREKDGTLTHCTREANHRGGCYWPERKHR